jgi:glycosyltransferase involved in cell wall biosynthesis
MKILISAYACEPHKGSEQEVGWRWVLDASQQYEKVVVLTRKNNRLSIEKEILNLGINNIEFLYFDLPKWASFWKKGGRGIQLYSYLWEVFSFFYLKKHFKKSEFDYAQRVTFVSYRFPSLLWFFAKEFTLGPVAGGERFPLSFLLTFTLKGKIKELLRMIAQRAALIDPLVLLTLYKSKKIIAVTEETKSILPKFAQKKTIIQPAISIDINDFNIDPIIVQNREDNQIKLLYVGRLLEWKGLILALEALKSLPKELDYVFNIIGRGEDKTRLKNYAIKHSLNVNFLGHINRQELSNYYINHDLFIFPSLHDSGGMVILEAQAHGLNVLVSSFGGPKEFTQNNDIVIKADNPNSFINNFLEAIHNEF